MPSSGEDTNMLRYRVQVITCLFLLSCMSQLAGAESASAIDPSAAGEFLLPAQAAKLTGKPELTKDAVPVLEDWSSGDSADWQVNIPKMGNYDVAVTWSVTDDIANRNYNIDVNHRSTIRAFTLSTGGKLKREFVGRIMLPPGKHWINFHPGRQQGELCKLQQIELVPVASNAAVAPDEPVVVNVPKGFEVELVAGPPLTSHPILACLDDRGRLFVGESTGVNADAAVLAESPPHEIRVLEDTNGDGRYDKSKIFADKLTFPQGMLWHEGSLYVASPPKLWRFKDTDGDDVADEREVILTGFPFRGMSDDMHGATLGPDGRIYTAAGRFGHRIRRPNGPPLQTGADPVIVRCRPDGSDLEIFSGALGNVVGTAFTDAGDCISSGTFGVSNEAASNGKRDAMNHNIHGAAYTVLSRVVKDRKWTGGLMPNLMEFGVSATSDLMIYRDKAFGSEYRGNLFTALFNLHKVMRHVLEPDGATFRCKNEEFLSSPDADFHPTDVLEDADGSLIVVDTGAWFLIGCPTSVIAKPQISGGIYRVKSSTARKINDPWGLEIAWEKLSAAELVSLLDDSRFAVRDRAMRVLAAQALSRIEITVTVPIRERTMRVPAEQRGTAVAALKSALRNSVDRIRLNAVWTLARIDGSDAAAAVYTVLGDPSAEVRQAAATAAGLFRDPQALPALMDMVRSDKSLPVRREAATALGRIGNRQAVPALLASLAGVSDRFLDHAIIFALITIDDRDGTLPGLTDESPEVCRGALIALDQMNHGELSQAEVTRALENENSRVQQTALEVISRHKGWADQITELSKRWLADPKLPQDRQAALRGVLLAFADNPDIQKVIADSLLDKGAPNWRRLLLLDVVGRSELAEFPVEWQQPVLAALGSDDIDCARAAVSAVASASRKPDQPPLGQQELLSRVRNEQGPNDLRVAAAAAAIVADQPIPDDVFDLLVDQCRGEIEPVTRLAAAGIIGSAELSDEQLSRVIELISKAGPLETPILFRSFENRDSFKISQPFLLALEKSPGLNAIPGDRLVKIFEKVSPSLRAEVDLLLKRTAVDPEGQRKRLAELKDALTGGDAEHGRQLFFGSKASCSACHRVGTEGGNIGPNLAGIGEIRTRRDLLEAVAFPSASFARGFEPYTVLMSSGVQHAGIISRTTNDALYLVTPERATIRIPRSEIEDQGIIPSRVSIMPQGLDRILQPAELQDLLAFLTSLKDKTKP